MDTPKELKKPTGKRKTGGILKTYLNQIIQWRNEGYTKKVIFEYLINKKIIDCKYNNFLTALNILIAKEKEISKSPSHQEEASQTPKKKFTDPPIKKSFVMVDLPDSAFEIKKKD